MKYRHAKTPHEYLSQRSKVLESGCVEFTAGKDKDGYGQVQSAVVAQSLKVTRAHQLAYVAYKGSIPSGMFVCHSCDNPSCINPDHLFLGTAKENNDDMVRKGRGRYPGPTKPASNPGPRKIDMDSYNELMSLQGVLHAEKVADKFGMHWSSVYAYWRGERAPK